MSATESAAAGTAAFPGLLGAVVLVAGPPAGAGVAIWAALIGGFLGGYGGSTFQLLRELDDGTAVKTPTPSDWLRLGMRVSASAAFGVLAALTIAALAGQIQQIPHIVAHPFVIAGISGGLAFVAPIAVPKLQAKAGKAIDNYRMPGQ